MIDKLLVYPERMQKNLDRMGGLVHSQRVLLALTQAGLSREDSYALVQRNAMKVWESDGQLSLLDLLKADPEVTAKLSGSQLEELFDLGYHLKQRRHDLRAGLRGLSDCNSALCVAAAGRARLAGRKPSAPMSQCSAMSSPPPWSASRWPT